jgi:hypothetical protein
MHETLEKVLCFLVGCVIDEARQAEWRKGIKCDDDVLVKMDREEITSRPRFVHGFVEGLRMGESLSPENWRSEFAADGWTFISTFLGTADLLMRTAGI